MDRKLPLDFILSFSEEKIPDHGEDSFCHGFCDGAGMLAVFDGCGGSGGRSSAAFGGHTHAYAASRLCAGVFYESFHRFFPGNWNIQELVDRKIMPELRTRFARNAPKEDMAVGGSLVRTLPTTAAAAFLQQQGDGNVRITSVWAGDSRVYLLDARGLAQLTADDTNQPDPMENHYDDGILSNVICADRPMRLNVSSITAKPPFMVFAATDGCFGYVSSPMLFEGLLLETMLQSSWIAEWEDRLKGILGEIAGDDHSMCMASVGFGDFEAVRNTMAVRFQTMEREYLSTLWHTGTEDRETHRRMWRRYRKDYMRYLEGEAKQ